jgi:hypothetical protein
VCYNDDRKLNQLLQQEYQRREEDEKDARGKLQFLYLQFVAGGTNEAKA